MKHFSYLTPKLPKPATPHAKACMEKIRTMFGKPLSAEEDQPERQPGEDREEDDAQPV